LSIEANPELAKKLGITTVPTILVYRRGESGLAMVGRKSAPLDESSALNWLADYLTPATFPNHDPDVVRTLGHRNQVVVQASPQQVAQPPVVSQPQVVVQQQPVVQQPVTMTLQTTPMVSTPITGPQAAPVVLQPSSAPVVVQPSPTHILVGPSPAPIVTFVQGPAPAPQVSVAAPAGAQPNLFVSGPQAQPQQPSVAPSPQQQTQVSNPQVTQAQAAPQQTVQLVSTVQAGQPLVQSQGGAGVQTALLLQQPNVINRMLAGLGRHLVQKGNPRLMMNTATPLTVQVPTTMAVQTQNVAAPQQVTSVPSVQAPPPVVASPQSGHHHGFGWFHHDD
jgi:hypothetical protein